MSGLKNKVAIITGASGGIGGATAVEFARIGARLCITGRNEEKLKATQEKCVQAGLTEENVLVVIGDVTKQEDIAKIVNKTVEAFKQIDVLDDAAMDHKVDTVIGLRRCVISEATPDSFGVKLEK